MSATRLPVLLVVLAGLAVSSVGAQQQGLNLTQLMGQARGWLQTFDNMNISQAQMQQMFGMVEQVLGRMNFSDGTPPQQRMRQIMPVLTQIAIRVNGNTSETQALLGRLQRGAAVIGTALSNVTLTGNATFAQRAQQMIPLVVTVMSQLNGNGTNATALAAQLQGMSAMIRPLLGRVNPTANATTAERAQQITTLVVTVVTQLQSRGGNASNATAAAARQAAMAQMIGSVVQSVNFTANATVAERTRQITTLVVTTLARLNGTGNDTQALNARIQKWTGIIGGALSTQNFSDRTPPLARMRQLLPAIMQGIGANTPLDTGRLMKLGGLIGGIVRQVVLLVAGCHVSFAGRAPVIGPGELAPASCPVGHKLMCAGSACAAGARFVCSAKDELTNVRDGQTYASPSVTCERIECPLTVVRPEWHHGSFAPLSAPIRYGDVATIRCATGHLYCHATSVPDSQPDVRFCCGSNVEAVRTASSGGGCAFRCDADGVLQSTDAIYARQKPAFCWRT